jgi:hypothetical protein
MLKLIFAAALVAGPLACFPLVMPAAAEAPVKDPVVVKECGGCHMVYHPIFLPARSWEKILAGLRDHFGENAELDEATTKHIAEYLKANAGDRGYLQGWASRGLSANETPLRIIDAPWWRHVHERHSSDPVLQRGHSKAKGNCATCHSANKRGYSEDNR